MNEAQIIYYDLLPDYTVSVLVKGCDEWDLLKSMSRRAMLILLFRVLSDGRAEQVRTG
ncbi:hypothetical protein I2701_004318 [Vibrio parahaemolyticus]|nr:hypothetical protein [Vibrio parahaemolyticus]ELC9530962.1 hypothetical protein [Vibrio parahaemolyticus]